jgi:hypothetical protein
VAISIPPDARHAASHLNMADHLTAPFEAGARSEPLVIASSGDVMVDRTTRHPVILVAPAEALNELPWSVELRPAATNDVIVLRFAPYTEEDAYLPGLVPAVDSLGQAAQLTFNVKLRVDGTLVAQSSVPQRLHMQVVEGVLAKTLLLLGSEKARLRRQGRELAAMRLLSGARDDALDRLGAEVAVPRFADRLDYKFSALVSTAKREPDDDYRRRIRLYHRSFMRTPGEIRELLNGPGADTDPNVGAIGKLAEKVPAANRAAYQKRFTVDEQADELAVAIHLVAAGDSKYRDNFLEFMRAAHLIWPKQTVQADAVHEARYLPRGKAGREERYDHEQRLRKELRSLFDFGSLEAGAEPALALGLAEALIRAARCIKALGGPVPLPMFRAQRGDRGSRYELGLGADVKRLTGAELAAMRTQHAQLKAADPEFGQIQNPDPNDTRVKKEIQGLLKTMQPTTAAADPDGRWLFGPCGLRTVHRLPAQANAPWPVTYLSHFPVHGMVIEEKAPQPAVPVGGWTELAAGYPGTGDFDAVVSFEREAHAGQVWTTEGDGTLTGRTRDTTWQPTITHIAMGAFVGGFHDVIVVYDASTAALRVHGVTAQRVEAAPLVSKPNVGSNWTDVATLGLPGVDSYLAMIVLYDRRSGDLAIYGVETTSTGQQKLVEKRTKKKWRPGWTHITGVVNGPGYGELFCYDRHSREGAFYEQSAGYDLSLRGHVHHDLGSWTHVFAGRFTKAPAEGIAFFDQGSGLAELRDAELAVLGRHRKWPRSASQFVTGHFSNSPRSDVLVYERVSGHVSMWETSDEGEVSLLRDSNTFPRSPGHEVLARYHAPGDPGTNVVLADGLANALAAWAGLGEPAWTVLTRNQTEQAWQQAAAHATTDVPLVAFAKAGLPVVTDPQALVPKLMAVEPDLVAAIKLDAAQSQAVVSNSAAAEGILRGIAGLLANERLTSLLPLVTTGDEVVLVVGAEPLPAAGTNLYEAPSTGFRWYVVPIEGAPGAIRASGAKTEYAPAEPGLCALVSVGYARRDGTEPYEFRVELPAGALLTFEQYEWLMNLLGHAYPAGVRVNTWSIRQQHVDLKIDQTTAPLDPTISRTFRAFRRIRQRGLSSVTLADES